jgi:polar amino acid transport system permease protein
MAIGFGGQPAGVPPEPLPSPAGPPPARLRQARGGRRGLLISSLSTLAFFGVLAVVLATAPGVQKVGQSFFSPSHFRDSWSSISAGFVLNLELMLVAEAIVLVFALLIAVVRSLPGPAFLPLRIVAIAYTDVFRGVPLILVVFMVGLGLPGMRLQFLSYQSLFTYGVVALVLVYSAYVTEVYRAGIDSVHPSQLAAARSLGLSHWQSLRHVVIPQAVRRVIPPLLNDFIGLQKDTALVGLLGLVEVSRAAENYSSDTFNFTGYTLAALLFLLITIPLARFTDYLIERDRRRRRA